MIIVVLTISFYFIFKHIGDNIAYKKYDNILIFLSDFIDSTISSALRASLMFLLMKLVSKLKIPLFYFFLVSAKLSTDNYIT